MRLTCALRRMVLTICHSERSEESYWSVDKILAKHTSCRKKSSGWQTSCHSERSEESYRSV